MALARVAAVALLLLLLLPLAAFPHLAEASPMPPPPEGFYEVFYSPVEGRERILWPTWSYPAVVEPGGELRVNLSFEAREASGFIVEVSSGVRVELEYLGLDVEWSPPALGVKGPVTIVFKVPGEAPDGLYNLYLDVEGRSLWMPRAVLVSSRGPERLVIFHMTDVHVGASNKGIMNDAKIARYVVAINTLAESLGVNLVVATGDIADIGTQAWAYRSFYYAMNQVLVPTLTVPGNHDWAQVPREEYFLNRFFGKYVVPGRSWVWVWGDFAVVGLDSGSRGFFDENVMAFLEEALEALSDKKVVLAFHHPIFSRSGEYKGGPERLSGYLYSSWREHMDVAARVLNLVEEHKNVVAVLSGHVHRDADAIYERSDGSKVYFITTTTLQHGYPRGYYWGAKIVVVERDGNVKVLSLDREYRLDKGSINFEPLNIYTTASLDGSSQSWVYSTEGFKAFNLSEATLTFILRPDADPSLYYNTTVGTAPTIVGEVDLVFYKLYIAKADLRGEGTITLASRPDNEPPSIKVAVVTPSTPRVGSVVTVVVNVGDEGWGVIDVRAWLAGKDGKVEATVAMGPKRGEYIVRAEVSEGASKIVIEAVDAAGNKAVEELELAVRSIETTTTTTPPAQTTPTTATETYETGYEAKETITDTGPKTTATNEKKQVETITTTPILEEGKATITDTATAETPMVAGGDLIILAAAIAAAIIIVAAALRAKSP
ncbi:MAG: metallophosphoesterase [Desulfurococcales archaeon]|nr:metallophosphoesterase [Desulfurococcales archaeon]